MRDGLGAKTNTLFCHTLIGEMIDMHAYGSPALDAAVTKFRPATSLVLEGFLMQVVGLGD